MAWKSQYVVLPTRDIRCPCVHGFSALARLPSRSTPAAHLSLVPLRPRPASSVSPPGHSLHPPFFASARGSSTFLVANLQSPTVSLYSSRHVVLQIPVYIRSVLHLRFTRRAIRYLLTSSCCPRGACTRAPVFRLHGHRINAEFYSCHLVSPSPATPIA